MTLEIILAAARRWQISAVKESSLSCRGLLIACVTPFQNLPQLVKMMDAFTAMIARYLAEMGWLINDGESCAWPRQPSFLPMPNAIAGPLASKPKARWEAYTEDSDLSGSLVSFDGVLLQSGFPRLIELALRLLNLPVPTDLPSRVNFW